MSESDGSRDKEGQSPADRTLLGVAPPKLDSLPDLGARSPVFVRSGTSVAPAPSDEPPPLPRMALPSRPVAPLPDAKLGSELPPPLISAVPLEALSGAPPPSTLERLLGLGRRYPVLWMVGAPVLAAAVAVVIFVVGSPPPATPHASIASGAPAVAAPAVPSAASPDKGRKSLLAELEGRPPESLSAREIMNLAQSRAESRAQSAEQLRLKVEAEPALAQDKAVQAQLLALAADPEPARAALITMTRVQAPVGADLLYEVWTGTAARNDATELARALVYSTDVKPTASPALAVALELRTASTCEQNKAALPKALAEGDRRSLHLLTKLQNKRGCGPKKTDDCFACLREPKDELAAVINAVKARRAPSYAVP